MNRAEFLKQVEDCLDMTETLTPDQVLVEIPDYDSLAILNLLALYDGLGLATTPEEVSAAVTAEDLIGIARSALSDG